MTDGAVQVGWQLLNFAGDVVQSWGGVVGQVAGVPDFLVLPGEPSRQVFCPVPGVTYGEGNDAYTLVPWMKVPQASDYTLQRYQFLALMSIANLTSLVAPAIAAISDPVARAVAQAKYDSTQTFSRDDATLNLLASNAGLDAAQVDAYWLQAKGL